MPASARPGIRSSARSPSSRAWPSSRGLPSSSSFPDVITLHALVAPPADPGQIGTDITLTGVNDADVEAAKRFFVRYSGEKLLESTEYGDVLARPDGRRPARIYVKGLFADDLNGYATGRLHDELAWRDVALHACRVLQTNEKVVFVTPWQMAEGTAQMRYAQDDGYRVVVVPDDIARSLGSLTDLNGRPLVDLSRYRDEWNDSFSFTFVDPAAMTPAEQAVYARTREIAALAKVDLTRRRSAVLISETMRLSNAGDPVLGIWEGAEQRIVIRRDQLTELAKYAGTLLHEIGHMVTGSQDGTLDFESGLSRLLGIAAAAALAERR